MIKEYWQVLKRSLLLCHVLCIFDLIIPVVDFNYFRILQVTYVSGSQTKLLLFIYILSGEDLV